MFLQYSRRYKQYTYTCCPMWKEFLSLRQTAKLRRAWAYAQSVQILCYLQFKRSKESSRQNPYEPHHDKTNKVACAPSEDSDQPGHLPSLIKVFTVRMKKAWVLSYPLSTQLRLIRLGGCAGWSESLLGTHAILFVLSWFGSYKPCHKKTCLWGLRPGKTQTGLLSYRD